MGKGQDYEDPHRLPVVEPIEIWATVALVIVNLLVWGPYLFWFAYLTIPDLLSAFSPIEP